MQLEAQSAGVIAVSVHLAPVSLAAMHANLNGVKAAMASKAQLLRAELGTAALDAGRWENGIGQLGLQVTAAGLKLLQNSSNAVSFSKDVPWQVRSDLDQLDGSLAEIAKRLDQQGIVDVVVTLNFEGLEHEMQKDGVVRFKTAKGHTNDDVAAKLGALLAVATKPVSAAAAAPKSALALANQLSATQLSAPDKAAAFDPRVTLRLTREGVLALASNDMVRKMVPVGFSDSRAARLESAALTQAKRDGTAEVLISVRNPLAGGKHSPDTYAAMKRSNRRNLDAVMADAGIQAKAQDLSEFGAVAVRLTAAELQSLFASNDARLLAVELNKPMAVPMLNVSTTTMNMPSAWNAGYRAAGQYVIIMDSGVQANHVFFRNASGVSRVTTEACFGSTQAYTDPKTGATTNYQSLCPSADVDGDSPLGLVGAAAPVLNCSTVKPSACVHGTHVAGISAGRSSTAMPNTALQGVAPDAGIVAVQVFSFDAARVQQPQAFTADLVKGMQVAVGAMTAGTLSNPFTVNSSLGSGNVYPGNCSSLSPTFAAAVQSLRGLGVPVVAATGNGNAAGVGYLGLISWPACTSGIIKVGSTTNNGVGTTISSFTNLPTLSNFSGEVVWMVPGGGGTTSVVSAVAGTSINGTGGLSGTSQASPHVTGLYAAIKAAVPGISVPDASSWIQGNASIAMTPVAACDPNFVGPCVASTYRRIVLPTL